MKLVPRNLINVRHTPHHIVIAFDTDGEDVFEVYVEPLTYSIDELYRIDAKGRMKSYSRIPQSIQDKVIEVARLNKDSGKELTPCADKTEVKGENLGFFRKYFGGVGQYNPLASQNQSGRM